MARFTQGMINAIRQCESGAEMSAVADHLTRESDDLGDGAQQWANRRDFPRSDIYHRESVIYLLLSSYARTKNLLLKGDISQVTWDRTRKIADEAVNTAWSVDSDLESHGLIKAAPSR